MKRISEAIDKAEKLARNATGLHWTSNGSWEIRTEPSGSSRVTDRSGVEEPYWYQIMKAPNSELVGESIHEFKLRLWSNAALIASNDPSVVLRVAASDRRVLQRHHRVNSMAAADPAGEYCAYCSSLNMIGYPFPCLDILDLADRRGVL